MERLLLATKYNSSLRVYLRVLEKGKNTLGKEQCERVITVFKERFVPIEQPVTSLIEYHHPDTHQITTKVGAVSTVKTHKICWQNAFPVNQEWTLYVEAVEEVEDKSASLKPATRVKLVKSQRCVAAKHNIVLEHALNKEGRDIDHASATPWKYSCRFVLNHSSNMRLFWQHMSALFMTVDRLVLPQTHPVHVEVNKLSQKWQASSCAEMEARFGHFIKDRFVPGVTREQFYNVKNRLDKYRKWLRVTECTHYQEDYINVQSHSFRRSGKHVYLIQPVGKCDVRAEGDGNLSFRVAVKNEKLIQDVNYLRKLDSYPPTHSRYKWRIQYQTKCGICYDLTFVEPELYEIEIERTRSHQCLDSFIAKIRDIVPRSVSNTDIELAVVHVV